MKNKAVNTVNRVFWRIRQGISKMLGSIEEDNRGVGIVEVILILVILIAVVLLFKNQITEIVNRAFTAITSDSNGIIG